MKNGWQCSRIGRLPTILTRELDEIRRKVVGIVRVLVICQPFLGRLERFGGIFWLASMPNQGFANLFRASQADLAGIFGWQTSGKGNLPTFRPETKLYRRFTPSYKKEVPGYRDAGDG